MGAANDRAGPAAIALEDVAASRAGVARPVGAPTRPAGDRLRDAEGFLIKECDGAAWPVKPEDERHPARTSCADREGRSVGTPGQTNQVIAIEAHAPRDGLDPPRRLPGA